MKRLRRLTKNALQETPEMRWDLLNALDDEFLKGGVIISEWCAFIVRSADAAFVAGAFLASILTAVAGIETYLRSEGSRGSRQTFAQLIDESGLRQPHIVELHVLRQYRNRWVHVNDPWDDSALLDNPEEHEEKLEEMALFASRLLRQTIYSHQFV